MSAEPDPLDNLVFVNASNKTKKEIYAAIAAVPDGKKLVLICDPRNLPPISSAPSLFTGPIAMRETNRSIRLDLATPVEAAIRHAKDLVEALPAHTKVTDASVFLSRALLAVGSYIDEQLDILTTRD